MAKRMSKIDKNDLYLLFHKTSCAFITKKIEFTALGFLMAELINSIHEYHTENTNINTNKKCFMVCGHNSKFIHLAFSKIDSFSI